MTTYPPLPSCHSMQEKKDAKDNYDIEPVFSASQMRAYVDADRARRAAPAVPAKLGEYVACPTESDEHYAKRNGYVDGWNECVDAMLSASHAAPSAPDHSGDAAEMVSDLAHIKAPYTASEILARYESNDFSPELLLQHAVLILRSMVAAPTAPAADATAFALQALVASGHVTQAKVDEALAIAASVAPAAPKPLTDSDLTSACLSYRHDFGLLPTDERERLMLTAMEWARAFGLTTTTPKEVSNA